MDGSAQMGILPSKLQCHRVSAVGVGPIIAGPRPAWRISRGRRRRRARCEQQQYNSEANTVVSHDRILSNVPIAMHRSLSVTGRFDGYARGAPSCMLVPMQKGWKRMAIISTSVVTVLMTA